MTSIAYRASASGTATTVGASKQVVIPATVQAGDLMILGYAGSQTQPDATPAGWTLLQQGQGGTVFATWWFRVAQAGDAGTTVTITAASNAKTALTLVAWSGVSTSSPIAASAIQAETASSTTHAGPAMTLPGGYSGWIARSLALKDTSTAPSTTYTPPSGTVRVTAAVGGGSQPVSVMGGSGADVGSYTAGVWTVDAASPHAVTLAVALAGISATTQVRPIADISSGGAAPNSGTDMFAVLADESDATYVETPAGGCTSEWRLGPLAAVPNVISCKGYAAGGAAAQSVHYYLMQGTTVIADFGAQTVLQTSAHEYRFTLTSGQQAAITDLTDLRVRRVVSVS